MNAALVVIVALLCAVMLFLGFARRGAIYEFPFLAAAMSAAFILPQLPGLSGNIFLPADGFARAVIFMIGCLTMAWIGWGVSSRPLISQPMPLSESRLLIAAALLSSAGAAFYIAVGRLPPETMISVAISGVPVVLLFFSKMLVIGFAIAVLCAARRLSTPAILIALGDTVLYLDRVYVTGKRGEAFEFILIVALGVWFQTRRALPRAIVAVMLVAGVIGLTSTEHYRAMTRRGESPGFEDIAKIDFLGNFETLVAAGGEEFQNAIMQMDFVARTQQYDYGLYHWNELVMAFVPAQVVGVATKRSFLIEVGGSIDRFYEPLYGTTNTGLYDAFTSFGYLGALKFFLVAWLMRRIYRGAMSGDATSQLIYMLSALPAMHVFSHHTNWILTAWIQMAMFIGPALLYARSANTPPKLVTAAAA